MKIFRAVCLILALTFAFGCAKAPSEIEVVEPDSDKPQSVAPLSAFTLSDAEPSALTPDDLTYDDADLHALIAKIGEFSAELCAAAASGEENLVLSPFSVYVALACLSNGASGQTYEELKTLLYPEGMDREAFNDACEKLLTFVTYDEGELTEEEKQWGVDPSKALTVRIETLACTQNGYAIDPDFAAAAKRCFAADTANADFSDPAATEAINGWASEQTEGLIPELFSSPIDPQTVLLLANSIYFEGQWTWKFNADDNEKNTFHGATSDAEAEFMLHDGFQYYDDTDAYQAIRLTYEGGAYMEILLPHEDVTAAEALSLISDGRVTPDYEEVKGVLRLPKFSIESGTDLKELISGMGAGTLFDADACGLDGAIAANADAPGQNALYVTSALQKARIEVDEEGTRAAAVTVMLAAGAALPPDLPPFEMICDRPFVYRVGLSGWDTPIVLFAGTVNDIA